MTSMVLESTITCPTCGHAQRETIQFYYECTGCPTLLRPRPGHCCVFCPYGTVACPPIQAAQPCCGASASWHGTVASMAVSAH